MIDLGLGRIARLLKLIDNPHLAGWKAVHVAGTNGKGSVCAYVSSCLYRANVVTGRFTSPHLVNKWDCIAVNEKPISEDLFRQSEMMVSQANKTHNVGATEFELLTATAFDIFRKQQVEVAIVEVGLGGRLDSTNVLPPEHTLVTVITKVGLDHQNLLGSTLGQIGREKAGIIKHQVACVVDATNDKQVLDSVLEIAQEQGSQLIFAEPDTLQFNVPSNATPLLGAYQLCNLSCALNALTAISKTYPQLTDAAVLDGIRNTSWPGRLQWLELEGGEKHVLLDGAHNKQASELLKQYIDSSVRKTDDQPVTYVLAFSQGKDYADVLKTLLQPQDRVIVTTFGDVDGMPWVRPCPTGEVASVAASLITSPVVQEQNPIKALHAAPDSAVVCGSLYLVGHVLRFHGK
ncbi:hypothetical protein TRICI_001582 [Trichomonascus ciferrii]|uniref:Uncharacterized protein n=1 Tax=Trichomonascus ciferrii TaxID=44093 RepID=A0A642V861_9ASCO|nr:hypothetical protein TRICI_001582 [Trichomonascus ciferrii]